MFSGSSCSQTAPGVRVAVEERQQLVGRRAGRAARRARRRPARCARRARPSRPTRPCRCRRRSAGPRRASATNGSSRISSNDPVVSVLDRRAGLLHAAGPTFGAKMTAACAARVWTCRRSRWKYCAAVVALQTWMLSSAAGGEEPLDAGRRVLRALALVAVGQQQHEPVVLAPLVLGGDEVLVDDHLGAVDEVAELRLPHDERLAGSAWA